MSNVIKPIVVNAMNDTYYFENSEDGRVRILEELKKEKSLPRMMGYEL